MATIHVVNNIFSGASQADYYIDPSKLVYSNASIDGHGDWYEKPNVTVYYPNLSTGDPEGNSYFYAHTIGFMAAAGPGWTPSGSHGLDTLTIRFANAAYKRSSSGTPVYATLKVEIIDAYGYNHSSSAHYFPMIALANDSDSGETGFWIQSYLEGHGSDGSDCTGSATVRMTIEGDAGATFALPFTDIDVNYDAVPSPEGGRPGGVGSKYAENIVVNPEGFSGTCTDIYAKTDSWLAAHIGGGDPVPIKNLNGRSYSDPIRLDNGSSSEEGEATYGVYTGVVCIFKSGAQIIWKGSRCGTSLRGGSKVSVHKVEYLGNPLSPSATVTPASIIDYKWRDVDLDITSIIPIHTPPGSATASRAVFIGWAKSSSGDPYYSAPGSGLTTHHTITDNLTADLYLYARWRIDYLVKFIANSSRGSGQPNNIGYIVDVPHSIIAHTASNWYTANTRPVFPSDWRVKQLGYNATGWSSTNDGTKDYDISAQLATLTGPTDYYATFSIKTYTVTFHDGFTPGSDIIKKVTVAYDNDVPQADIPVSGQTYTYYDGTVHKFKKPGFYTFAGWSGSLTHIKDNIDVYAMWEFIPIWVMTNGQWVKYDPVEI